MSLPKHKCPAQQNQNKLSTIRVRKETNSVGRHVTNIVWVTHLSKHRVTNSANRASDTSRPCLSHQVRGQCLKLCRPLPPSKNQLVIFPIPDEWKTLRPVAEVHQRQSINLNYSGSCVRVRNVMDQLKPMMSSLHFKHGRVASPQAD